MNEELSVHDMSVTMNDAGAIIVNGSGSPEGATVSVTVSLTGGGTATNTGTVVSGAFQIQVGLTGSVNATGEVEATITDDDFPGKEGIGYFDFKIK